MKSSFWIAFALILISAMGLQAADHPSKFYVIYDSSNSMWGALDDDSRKYEAGRKALSAFLDRDFAGREIAFRAYGHREKADCRDTELMVPFSDPASAKGQITQAMESIRPTGKTPITHSLRQALQDFGDGTGDILLVSDGIETCDKDPCDLMRDWKNSNVDIRVHVVGVGLQDFERQAMACIAEISGGQYFDADSEDRFADALQNAGNAITASKPEPKSSDVDGAQGYALRIVATDEQGRAYVVAGRLLQDGTELGEVKSHHRNILEGPGDYTIEVGPVLADGSLFEPVQKSFTVEGAGETTVEVTVTRPAMVSALFLEEGKEHPGSLVSAYQDGNEVFRFRAFDEVLARPGLYEFRAQPNKDNNLKKTEALEAGKQTEIVFELNKTINFFIVYVLPNGEIVRRNSTLMRGGEVVYNVHGQNGGWARPGRYEVQSPDDKLPLTPMEIDVMEEGETIRIPLEAAFLQVSYAPSDDSYLRPADRASIRPVSRKGTDIYARPNTVIPVSPGTYDLIAYKNAGYFDTQRVSLANNETADVVFTPKPLGQVIITYAPSDSYKTDPDRAFVEALDGQELKNGFVRPGNALKLLPGRYRVNGWRAAGDIPPKEFTITAHETVEVKLFPAP